jgi:hypothetical protein
MTIQELRQAIESHKARSAWERGVKVYALELLDDLQDGGQDDYHNSPADKKALLNGASDWNQYSWGGCSLIYDEDIAQRLCTSSELKRTRNGERRPNGREEWLDCQARALYQAANLISHIVKVSGRRCTLPA